jgi:cytochrome oxidase Cu insertion factor (SCO1/SenC/PrrC family)
MTSSARWTIASATAAILRQPPIQRNVTNRALTSAASRRTIGHPLARAQGDLMLNPGDKAPDFTGRDHDGNPVSLADLKGKTVVLWFYPKADTPG